MNAALRGDSSSRGKDGAQMHRCYTQEGENLDDADFQNEEESIGYVTCYYDGSNSFCRMRKQDRDHR